MQLRPRLNRRLYRSAAGGYLEVSPFDFHCNGPTETIRLLAPAPNIVGHCDHTRFDPGGIKQILREGRLGPRRLSLSVGLNRTIVSATGDFKVPMACPAEPRLQELKGLAPQVRACLNAKRLHLGCGLRAHAMKLRDRKPSYEGLGLVGHDGELAVRLALIGCELREELVAGNSSRGRQLGLSQDAGSYLLSRLPRRGDAAQIAGDIKVGLVKRERLDQARVVLEDRMDLSRHGAVNVEPWGDEHELGTSAHRNGRRHRGANPKAPRFVTRRRNHASLRRIADRHRSIFKIQVIALLDGRIESIHVDVNDLVNPPFFHWSMLVGF